MSICGKGSSRRRHKPRKSRRMRREGDLREWMMIPNGATEISRALSPIGRIRKHMLWTQGHCQIISECSILSKQTFIIKPFVILKGFLLESEGRVEKRSEWEYEVEMRQKE